MGDREQKRVKELEAALNRVKQESDLLKQERDTYKDRFQRTLRESQTQREQLERQISQNDQQLFRPLENTNQNPASNQQEINL